MKGFTAPKAVMGAKGGDGGKKAVMGKEGGDGGKKGGDGR